MSVQTVTPTDELESATGVIDRLLDAVADRATRDALGAILGALGRSHEAAIAWLAIKERTIHGPGVELSTWSDGPTISDSGITLSAQRGDSSTVGGSGRTETGTGGVTDVQRPPALSVAPTRSSRASREPGSAPKTESKLYFRQPTPALQS